MCSSEQFSLILMHHKLANNLNGFNLVLPTLLCECLDTSSSSEQLSALKLRQHSFCGFLSEKTLNENDEKFIFLWPCEKKMFFILFHFISSFLMDILCDDPHFCPQINSVKVWVWFSSVYLTVLMTSRSSQQEWGQAWHTPHRYTAAPQRVAVILPYTITLGID